MDTRFRSHFVMAALGTVLACGGSSSPPATAPHAAPPAQLAAATDQTRFSGSGQEGVSEQSIRQALQKAHARYKGLTEGKNADYIPILAQVDPELFGIAVTLTNG